MNDLTVVEHSGERVLTTEQLAEAYGCTARNINDNFNNNRERFEAGKHFYCLEGEDLSAFKHDPENIGLVASNASRLYLWTKRGAARHSKMLGTDRAWEMFDELEENYFNPQQKPMSELELMQASIKRLVDMEHKQDELSNQQARMQADIDDAHTEMKHMKTNIEILEGGCSEGNKRDRLRSIVNAYSVKAGRTYQQAWRDFNNAFNVFFKNGRTNIGLLKTNYMKKNGLKKKPSTPEYLELVDRLDDGLRVAIKLLNDARASRKPYMDMFNKED